MLIDQEGGRVVRLGQPHWREPPAAALLGRLAARDETAGLRAAWLNARLVAADLHALGITVNCMPVLDLHFADASKVVGDRSLGADPELVGRLGRAVARWPERRRHRAGGQAPAGPRAGGGRQPRGAAAGGRAARRAAARDFVPFGALRDAPAGLTAHVCYEAIDPDRPGTLSPAVIGEAVRGAIGFDGLLLSDDLSMGALTGSVGARAAGALAAGCDVALHCNGKRDEMEEVVAAAPRLGGLARARFERMLAARRAPEPFDEGAGRRELDALLGPVTPP